jgi:hypothetical protein
VCGWKWEVVEKRGVAGWIFGEWQRMALPHQVRRIMMKTKRRPASVGKILIEEFMEPTGLTQGALAEAMGVRSESTSMNSAMNAAA